MMIDEISERYARNEKLMEEAKKSGNPYKVFDWDKAARIIKERNPEMALAGLSEDWFWTGGPIWEKGQIFNEWHPYLKSFWATPVIVLENECSREEIPCWIYDDETVWDERTFWPESAKKILGCGEDMNDIKVPPFTDGQKKLIEMTEKLAGSRKICDVDDIDDVKDIKEIISETIAKIENQKQTNFQRITASPEALAEWIQDAMSYCCRCTADCATACKYYQRHGIVPCAGDGLVEWLKQESKE